MTQTKLPPGNPGRSRGFGVRVSPSGRKQFFIQCQNHGERVWKIVGDAGSTSVGEARSSAGEMLIAIRHGEEVPHRPDETLFEAVAETVFERHARLWKAGQSLWRIRGEVLALSIHTNRLARQRRAPPP